MRLPPAHHTQKRTKSHWRVKPPLIPTCQNWLGSTGFTMRPLLFFAAALVLIGGYVARYADNAIEHRADAQAAVVQPSFEPREPSSSGRSLMLEADRQGHFEVEARVEGRFIDFIVDTGASLVVLRESAAAQAGIRPPSQPTERSKLRRPGSSASRLAGLPCMTCLPSYCPMRRWPKTCSVSRFCHASSATNMPTAVWCLNSRRTLPNIYEMTWTERFAALRR